MTRKPLLRKQYDADATKFIALAKLFAEAPDSTGLQLFQVQCFFGGAHPVSESFVYRLIEQGILDPFEVLGPQLRRSTLGACRRAKQKLRERHQEKLAGKKAPRAARKQHRAKAA